MTGAEIAAAIAKASNGAVRNLPTGKDLEYAVVIQNVAMILVREFRASSIGVSVLTMRAWNVSSTDDPTTVIRESTHLAREWLSSHPKGVTALDVALEAAARIEKSSGFPAVLRTPGGQPAPTEMWLGDLGIFQQEDSVRVAGCRLLKSRDQLDGVCEKMVKLTEAATRMAIDLEKIKVQIESLGEALLALLDRDAPPPEGKWQISNRGLELEIKCGAYENPRVAAILEWEKGSIGIVSGLKGDRGFSNRSYDAARDQNSVVRAVRFQLSVLTPADVKIGDRFLVKKTIDEDKHRVVGAGEILRCVERLEEDHQPAASWYERESLPGRQRILITNVWDTGSALDHYLQRL